MTLRETVAWRVQDLLEQSLALYDGGHVLGARILLRAALESLAVLVYLNQLTRQVLAGTLDFHAYSEKTATLLLGSRDQSTAYKSLNILTILEKCGTRFPGIVKIYEALSESAHPNFEGTCFGYSEVDESRKVTTFTNKWKVMYGDKHIDAMEACASLFHGEYNDEWADAFEELERWIDANDEPSKPRRKTPNLTVTGRAGTRLDLRSPSRRRAGYLQR